MTIRFQSLLLSIGDIWNVVVAGAVGNWISVRESMGWIYLFDAKMSKDNQSCFTWINIRREDIDLSWRAWPEPMYLRVGYVFQSDFSAAMI